MELITTFDSTFTALAGLTVLALVAAGVSVVMAYKQDDLKDLVTSVYTDRYFFYTIFGGPLAVFLYVSPTGTTTFLFWAAVLGAALMLLQPQLRTLRTRGRIIDYVTQHLQRLGLQVQRSF